VTHEEGRAPDKLGALPIECVRRPRKCQIRTESVRLVPSEFDDLSHLVGEQTKTFTSAQGDVKAC